MDDGHTTPAGQSVFHDLFEPEKAANRLIRAQLMHQLTKILQARFSTQSEAAELLGVSQARISDLYRGKIGQFTVDMLINLLAKAGQQVEVITKAAA
ncbi:MAG: XRE family transcriptional regulator [Thiothrix sp.]|nr:XRE family transcriptional regulator [Thiothrix sp.]HPQ97093.1 helix-turn-helix transcriptional regulator [Thiolinea sp.]